MADPIPTPAAAPTPVPAPAAPTPEAAAPAAAPAPASPIAAAAAGEPAPAEGTAAPADGAAPAEGTPPEAPAQQTPAETLYKDGETAPGPEAAEPTEDAAAIAERASAYQEFTLPENFVPDEAGMRSFRELAAKRGLSQADAQALLNDGITEINRVSESFTQQAQQTWQQTQDEWKAAFQSDPEIGGAKMDSTLKTIGKALDQYGSPAVRQAFDLTGAGWHPEVIRFIHRMASKLTEGGVVPGGGPVPNAGKGGPRTPADTLYPNSQQ